MLPFEFGNRVEPELAPQIAWLDGDDESGSRRRRVELDVGHDHPAEQLPVGGVGDVGEHDARFRSPHEAVHHHVLVGAGALLDDVVGPGQRVVEHVEAHVVPALLAPHHFELAVLVDDEPRTVLEIDRCPGFADGQLARRRIGTAGVVAVIGRPHVVTRRIREKLCVARRPGGRRTPERHLLVLDRQGEPVEDVVARHEVVGRSERRRHGVVAGQEHLAGRAVVDRHGRRVHVRRQERDVGLLEQAVRRVGRRPLRRLTRPRLAGARNAQRRLVELEVCRDRRSGRAVGRGIHQLGTFELDRRLQVERRPGHVDRTTDQLVGRDAGRGLQEGARITVGCASAHRVAQGDLLPGQDHGPPVGVVEARADHAAGDLHIGLVQRRRHDRVGTACCAQPCGAGTQPSDRVPHAAVGGRETVCSALDDAAVTETDGREGRHGHDDAEEHHADHQRQWEDAASIPSGLSGVDHGIPHVTVLSSPSR